MSSEDRDLIEKLKETITRSSNSGATTEQWDRWFDVSTLDRDLRRKLSFHDLRRLGAHAIRAFALEQEGVSVGLPSEASTPDQLGDDPEDIWDFGAGRGSTPIPPDVQDRLNRSIPAPPEGRDKVIAFLLGEGTLDGLWFGDRHPTEKGAYWWRKHLRATAGGTRAPIVPPDDAAIYWALKLDVAAAKYDRATTQAERALASKDINDLILDDERMVQVARALLNRIAAGGTGQ